MGRQVNFFLHPDDQHEFDLFLKNFQDIVFIPYYHYSNKLSFINSTITGDIKTEGSRVYLARRTDLKDIKLKYIDTQEHWLVDDDGPKLDFDRCYFRDNSIHSGRLYFQTKFVQDSQWVDKPVDFVKWADGILKATRRKLKKYKYDQDYNFTTLLGDKAFNWLQQNDAVMQAGGHKLVPSRQISSH